MVFNIEVNNRIIQARKGETVLSALRRSGIKVPTLCNMKDFTPTGACRMCIVEVEGKPNLIPSCSYPVEEWMKITTHSPRVLKARKTIVELLLSNHPDDCLYCERSGNCELQELAEDLNVRERRIPGSKSKHKIDKSSPAIVRDPAKCLLCGRCVRVCEEKQAAATLDFSRRGSELRITTCMNKSLNFSNCISCGQCVVSCPTGALTEKIQFPFLDQVIFDHKKKVYVQYSPTIAGAIAEEFNLKPGDDIYGLINSALRKMGFDRIFETSFGADLLVMEQADEFITRYMQNENLPYITSCCPSWVKFAEQYLPEVMPNLCTFRSPQQITGSLIRTYVSALENTDPADIHSVSIMPCTAKKYEASRVEMTRKGLPDIDTVITTREFIRMIRMHGIEVNQLRPEASDEPLGGMSTSGKISGVSGGALESLLRTVYHKLTGDEPASYRINKLRSIRIVKEVCIKAGKREISGVAVSGIKNALQLLDAVKSGKKKYDIIEVMACQGGCVNGGGQPITRDESVLKNRVRAVYDLDNMDIIKAAHKNPQILKFYEELSKEKELDKIREGIRQSFNYAGSIV